MAPLGKISPALYVTHATVQDGYTAVVDAGSLSTIWVIVMIWPMRCVDILTLLWWLYLIDWKLRYVGHLVALVLGKPGEAYPVTVSWVVSLPAPCFESGQQSTPYLCMPLTPRCLRLDTTPTVPPGPVCHSPDKGTMSFTVMFVEWQRDVVLA